jgi:anaerobic magnesium-protoporphyrin IX monomethyl ester cyclase
MRLVLVGADYEENLGMCMIAAAAESAGHRTQVVPFQYSDRRAEVTAKVLALRPDVVGLAAQFQHRGMDFLGLACDLRRAGFAGHITAGGQFATMAHAAILSGHYGVDSVVLYEGENTTIDLLDAVAGKRPFADVAGLALSDGQGGAMRTAPRALAANLDCLPLAHRYRQHSRQYGVPFIPVSGSRGCWSSCSFCSITTVLRDGREHGVKGRRLRLRSPEDVGLEMAMLAQAVGGSAIFCFHDENFLLPRPSDSLARVAAMRRVLDEQGVVRPAIVGKCRPDTVTKELARELAKLGVVRMYVGIENASPNGAVHLARGVDVAAMSAALQAFADAGIFACYNLLIFEPQTTLDDVAQNIAFMRAHAGTPINFCRAEPYLGTPMHQRLRALGKLRGGFLGWDYRIEDDRAELMFRMVASAFRERNFASDGLANRYMSLGYSAKILEVFYKDGLGKCASLMERAQEITRSITLDSSELLEQALDVASSVGLADHDRVARETALLGLRIAASDRVWHAALDALERDMSAFARGEAQTVRKPASRVAKVAQGATVAGWLALWATGGGTSCTKPLDALPHDSGGLDVKKDAATKDDGPLVVDMAPPPEDARNDVAVYDPPPPDSGARNDVTVHDPLPPDAGARDAPADGTAAIDSSPLDGGKADAAIERPMVVDCVPSPTDARDSGKADVKDTRIDEPPMMYDPVVEARGGLVPSLDGESESEATAREHWADTSPRRMKRSTDLALCLCPELRLAGEWQDGKVRVRLSGVSGDFNLRWQTQGEVAGDGSDVLWTPISDEDQLDVAVRTRDGVAITLLRLEQVRGSKRA